MDENEIGKSILKWMKIKKVGQWMNLKKFTSPWCFCFSQVVSFSSIV
jgi:hypothetical protein